MSTPNTAQTLTPEGQRLADALVKAKAISHGAATGPIWLPYLNTAAALLLTAPEPEGSGLREALEPFARLKFSFDGFSLDPAELVVLGRYCGRFNPKEHSHLQKAIDAARAALAKQPEAQEPTAAGVVGDDLGAYWRKKWHALMGAYDAMARIIHGGTVSLPIGDYRTLVGALEADDTFATCEICGAWLTGEENSHGADINACWARAVHGGDPSTCRSYRALRDDATLTPAAPKTPDAATGGSVGDVGLREALVQCAAELATLHHGDCDLEHAEKHSAGLRMAREALAQPAPVGEDETGVREALIQCVAELATLHHGDCDMEHAEKYSAGIRMGRAALAPQPPKAETPAGVGEPTGWPAGYQETFDAIGAAVTVHGSGIGISVKEFYRALAYPDAALSTAPAARPGGGVERAALRKILQTALYTLLNRKIAEGYGNKTLAQITKHTVLPTHIVSAMLDALAAAPAADGGRA